MKRNIICRIDLLDDVEEAAWLVSMDVEDVATAIAVLCALRLGKEKTVFLVDKKKRKDTSMRLQIHRESSINAYTITYGCVAISATNEWLDSVLSMLIEVYLNGWSQSAHIDQEFMCAENRVTLYVGVCPPQ